MPGDRGVMIRVRSLVMPSERHAAAEVLGPCRRFGLTTGLAVFRGQSSNGSRRQFEPELGELADQLADVGEELVMTWCSSGPSRSRWRVENDACHRRTVDFTFAHLANGGTKVACERTHPPHSLGIVS